MSTKGTFGVVECDQSIPGILRGRFQTTQEVVDKGTVYWVKLGFPGCQEKAEDDQDVSES